MSDLTELDPAYTSSAFPTRQKPSGTGVDDSEDELSQQPNPSSRTQKRSSHNSTKAKRRDTEELKMETRKKERTSQPRRSTRGKKGDVLESDMVPDELAATPPKRKAPPRLKLDTARQRLRDDIALQSKAKANNFLVANKEYFLPLLPPNNHISKLIDSADTAPIVKYEELHEQPQG